MNDKYKGLLSLILAAFLGGAVTPTLIRYGVATLDPFVFNFFRAFATTIFLLPALWSARQHLQTRRFREFVILAGIGIGANTTFFALGIPHTTVVASQLLYALLPLSVPLLAHFLIQEKISSHKVIGSAIAFSGIILLVLFSRSHDQRLALGSFYGNAIIFLAVLFYTTYLVFSKKYTQHFSPIEISAATYLGTTLFFVPFLLYKVAVGTPIHLTPHLLLIISFLAIVSFLFIYCIQFGLRCLSATTMSITTLLSPEFGALAGGLVFHEQISFILVISMVLVCSGVLWSVSGEQQTWKYKLAWCRTTAQSLFWRS